MSTENESRQEGAANEENQNVSRDGGYKSVSYTHLRAHET